MSATNLGSTSFANKRIKTSFEKFNSPDFAFPGTETRISDSLNDIVK